MGLNIKLLLDKRRIKDNNTYPLVMRIIYNRKPINVPVGYSLLEKEWDSDRERIKASSKVSDDITRLNNLIHKKRTKAYDLMTKLADDGKLSVSSLPDIKKKLLGKDRDKTKNDVFSFIEYIIEDLTEAKRVGNAGVYNGLLKKFTVVRDNSNIEKRC